MNIPTVSIYGVKVSKLGFDETIRVMTERVERREATQVITVNPIMIMAGLDNPAYMSVLRSAELVIPDGAGVVWAAQYIGDPVVEKVAGIEVMHELLRLAETKGWSAYFVGTSPDIIEEAVGKLRERYPRLNVAGYRDGYFKAADDAQVVAAIREAAPDLLFVGRGADTQEPWIAKYKQELGVPLMMGVGGSFDIAAGRLKRAPRLLIRLRLEWFYRLVKEPTRWRRMLALPKFMIKVVRQKENVRKG